MLLLLLIVMHKGRYWRNTSFLKEEVLLYNVQRLSYR
jgi:hypothetical protein